MLTLTRRRTMTLAAAFAATAPLMECAPIRAQPKPAAGPTVFEMASFTGSGVDPDAVFDKAFAAIAKAAPEASKGGRPVVLNLCRNVPYRIKRPLLVKQLNGFELNGNGAQLINTTRGGSPHRSQQLMRLRVLLQFVAIVVIMFTVWIMAK